MRQISVCMPKKLVDALDSFVDKREIKSRTQLIASILEDWLAKRFDDLRLMIALSEDRKRDKKNLLG